jgi:phage host-nuclease inhibitor protein Gam
MNDVDTSHDVYASQGSLTETDGPAYVEGSDPFAITDASGAAWAADKVLAARERLERIKASCAAAIASAERDVASAERFFLPLLEAWARQHPPKKGKTIRLTTGALVFRSVPGGPRLADPDAALAWARANKPELIEVKERVTITALRGWIEASGGELPDGVEIVDARETFDVKG